MLVDDYLQLGLRLGRHIDGMVDAYYGPPELEQRVASEPIHAPESLRSDAADLITQLDEGVDDRELGADRRHWLRGQVVGLHTTARKLAGEDVSYADEVELCYGVRPKPFPEDELVEAHRVLDDALPGTGDLRDRYIDWREAQAIPVDKLDAAIHSLADDFRARTQQLFGLPEGEHIDFELAENKPWSGFNYYLGDLRSRVAINTDLPVLSHTLGHLVAHEAYPGHHTEHTRKEVGLVRKRQQQEETIFLVGTPQCLLAEGLADLGIEIIAGENPEPILAEHMRSLGIAYDPDLLAMLSKASDAMNAIRGNVAWMLHEEHADPEDAITYAMRWSLIPRNRAEKMLEFLTDKTWCSYISCYVEGLPLCRRYVAGDPTRFERLVTEQLLPSDLVAAA